MPESTLQLINLAKALRQLRRKQRLSANRLARILGISRRTLARSSI